MLVGFVMIALTIAAMSWVVFKIVDLTADPEKRDQLTCQWTSLLIGIGKYGTAGALDVNPACRTQAVDTQ